MTTENVFERAWNEVREALGVANDPDGCRDLVAEAVSKINALRAHNEPMPRAKYHEDDGAVLWWSFPIVEPPYCGQPDDSDWPESDDYTHWTPIRIPESPGSAGEKS